MHKKIGPMNQRDVDKKKIGNNITYCVKCQSDNISVDDKGFVCNSCGIKGIFEWYDTSKKEQS